jgi:hypothetical protein
MTTSNEKYDEKYLVDGQKGLADFTCDYVIVDDTGQLTYEVTDNSRGNARYLADKDTTVNDIGMLGLVQKVQPEAVVKAAEIFNIHKDNKLVVDIYRKGMVDVIYMDTNNAAFRHRMAAQISVKQAKYIRNQLDIQANQANQSSEQQVILESISEYKSNSDSNYEFDLDSDSKYDSDCSSEYGLTFINGEMIGKESRKALAKRDEYNKKFMR